MARSNEELVLWMCEIPHMPGVFALGNFASRVTFSSQQTRAFNLIQALYLTSRLSKGSRIAIVGGGLAGLTASVAALSKESFVDLYEQASLPCFQQRGNDTRFVHPNILDWPRAGSVERTTRFPYLNWTASTVRNVVRQVMSQWNHHTHNADRFTLLANYRVNGVGSSTGGRAYVSANTATNAARGVIHREYDAVILAVGFGKERTLPSTPFTSYWENDSLHQEMTRLTGPKSIVVSGCGDGGLTDALRLVLRDFDHADFIKRFESHLKLDGDIARQLLEIDESLVPHAHDQQIGSLFMEAYDGLPIPEDGFLSLAAEPGAGSHDQRGACPRILRRGVPPFQRRSRRQCRWCRAAVRNGRLSDHFEPRSRPAAKRELRGNPGLVQRRRQCGDPPQVNRGGKTIGADRRRNLQL